VDRHRAEPDDLRVTIRLNGKEMFTYAVKDAIFGVRQFISRMSQYLTLDPATCCGWARTARRRT